MVTCAPPMQGESHLNHCPHAPLPSFISPSPGSQTAPLLFPHHNTHIYIHHLHFYLLFVAQLYFTLALSPAPPHFRFFHHFMAIPLLPEPFPTLLYHNTLFYRAPHPMDDPPYSPAPACPLPPIFAFFHHFMAIPLLPAPFPTLLHPNSLFYGVSHLMDSPSCSPAPACPPTPHFRFFDHFMGAFL